MMIRKALIKDLESLMEIISDAKRLLKNSGSLQWNLDDGYPNKENILNDIINDVLYLYEENKTIIGMIAICGHDENYDEINGKWLTNKPYLSLHRIAVKEGYHNQNIGSKLIRFAEDFAVLNHIYSIKVDTHKLNIAMQKILTKNGYTYCGIIVLKRTKEDNLRVAYEKTVG